MKVSAGEIWLADTGGEVRRPVYVISNDRFHQLAGRAVVAPVVDDTASPWPWELAVANHAIAVHQLRTIHTDRLLEPVERLDLDLLRRVRRAVREIAT